MSRGKYVQVLVSDGGTENYLAPELLFLHGAGKKYSAFSPCKRVKTCKGSPHEDGTMFVITQLAGHFLRPGLSPASR